MVEWKFSGSQNDCNMKIYWVSDFDIYIYIYSNFKNASLRDRIIKASPNSSGLPGSALPSRINCSPSVRHALTYKLWPS